MSFIAEPYPTRPSRGASPRGWATRVEHERDARGHVAERVDGYGVIGLPFASGHVLALLRLPASPVGPGSSSVWHRDADGRWTLYTDVAAEQSCARYLGATVHEVVETQVRITWPAPHEMYVEVPYARLRWRLRLRASARTRAMSLAARLLPERAWRWPRLLAAVERAAAGLLDAGAIALHGRMPDGQRYRLRPRRLWMVHASAARIGDLDLGAPGALAPQARLGDFWLPQRGMLAMASAEFVRGQVAWGRRKSAELRLARTPHGA